MMIRVRTDLPVVLQELETRMIWLSGAVASCFRSVSEVVLLLLLLLTRC
jgi:hypothetical protein